jgi:hypothetical protein
MESTIRYLGIEVDDAPELAEQTEACGYRVRRGRPSAVGGRADVLEEGPRG